MKNQEVVMLFERLAEVLKMPITGERGVDTFYKREWLKLDFNSIYGGYRIAIVQKGTGEDDFDGTTRKSKKEMVAYLRGILKGLFIDQDRRIK